MQSGAPEPQEPCQAMLIRELRSNAAHSVYTRDMPLERTWLLPWIHLLPSSSPVDDDPNIPSPYWQLAMAPGLGRRHLGGVQRRPRGPGDVLATSGELAGVPQQPQPVCSFGGTQAV